MEENTISTESENLVDENAKEKGQQDVPLFDIAKLDKKSLEILEETEEDDYKFKLNQFEGPLALLLHLIKITKIDIRDIFLSDITEQYLKFMEDIDNVDTEKASEFISMAATLLEIKSKQLLPREPELADEDDPAERLIRQIEEYKLFQEQSEKLGKFEEVGKLYKQPDSTVGEFRYELPDQLSVDALISAFSNLMTKMTIKAEVVQEKKIVKDRFTVAQKISQIKDMLLTKNEFKFNELFESNDYSKSEIINTFLALLELLKRQYILVRQENLFGEIDIVKNPEEAKLTEEITTDYDGE